MIKTNLTLIAIALAALALFGCAPKQQDQWDAVAAQSTSFDEIWDACLASLEDRGFEVDLQDRRFGRIVTKPVVGKQFFEFWRNDTANSDDLLNSSLHTIRRTVSVTIAKPSPGAREFQVNVQARAERASIPGDQLDSTAEAFELLNSQGVPVSPRRSDYVSPRARPSWVDIGTEPALEQAIMGDIAKRLKS